MSIWRLTNNVKNAKLILDEEAVTQEEVEDITLILQNAKNGLMEKDDEVTTPEKPKPEEPGTPENPEEPSVPEKPGQTGDEDEKPQPPVVKPTDPDDEINSDVLGEEVDTTNKPTKPIDKPNQTTNIKNVNGVQTGDVTMVAPYAILAVCAIGMYMGIRKKEQ